jgi:hypothetical protein
MRNGCLRNGSNIPGPPPSEEDLWGAAFSEVLLVQQNTISRLVAVAEQVCGCFMCSSHVVNSSPRLPVMSLEESV